MPCCLAQGKTDRRDVRLRPPCRRPLSFAPSRAIKPYARRGQAARRYALPSLAGAMSKWRRKQVRTCHRYSSVTCPNRRSACLSLNLPISKSVVRTNATAPAWPNIFQSACARSIAAAGLSHSTGSPAAMTPSTKSKGNATKRVISAIGPPLCCRDNRIAKAREFELEPWPSDVQVGDAWSATRLHAPQAG
jgi:hypothetical protein